MDTNNLHVHQFKETVVPPTCRENGYTLYTCDCGYVHKANFKPVAAHNYQITQSTPATCEQPGSVSAVCSVCGEAHTQQTPPLGHDFSQWIVKDYPTCTTPGIRMRKCQRCGFTQESPIAPTGHKCAPQTARYVNGQLAEFFCENCGQTIRYVPQTAPAQSLQKPAAEKNYWPTRIVLLLAAVFTWLQLISMIGYDLDPYASFTNPWLTYGRAVIVTGMYVLLFLTAKKIRQNENHTKWVGFVALVYVILSVIGQVSNILWHVKWYSEWFSVGEIIEILLPSFVVNILTIAFYVVLMLVFFAGRRKKLWTMIMALAHTTIFGGLSLLGQIISYSNMRWFNTWQLFYTYFSQIAGLLCMVGLVMLVIPAKKVKQKNIA